MSITSPSVKGNAIEYPFGLKFKLKQVNKPGDSVVSSIDTKEDNVFFGLFDNKDIDFEILVDNIENKRNVSFDVKIEGQREYHLYIRSGMKYSLQALEHNGRRLHFVSQDTFKGQCLVALNARKNQINFEDASIRCSRMEINVSLESTAPETETSERFPVDGIPITIIIRFISGELLIQPVKDNYTIDDLEYLLGFDNQGNYSPLPPNSSRFIFNFLELKSGQTLNDMGINNGSILHYLHRIIRPSPHGSRISRLAAAPPKSSTLGERGVICFGDNSNQMFETHYGFKENDLLNITPFTIELRMKDMTTNN